MNGLPIPSDDVEKKNIDLNLFSTDVIKNVGISKTYDVSGYADMTSGNVDISSKTLSKNVSIGFSGGSNSTVLADGVYDNFTQYEYQYDPTAILQDLPISRPCNNNEYYNRFSCNRKANFSSRDSPYQSFLEFPVKLHFYKQYAHDFLP